MVAVTERLDTFQRRHPWAGFPLAVIYKFGDDQCPYLAALITYYGFLSVFPLLLLLASVLGYVLQGNPHLQQEIISSTLRQFPVIGQQLGDPKGLTGSYQAIIIGLISSLYGALGVAQAAQNAMNTMWAVPRNERPNPITGRGRSLVLLATGGLSFLVSALLAGYGSNLTGIFADFTNPLRTGASLLAILLMTAFFVFLFRFATTRDLRWRDVLPGAFAASVVWQLLQSFGALYVGHVVRDATATNGVFAIVLGMIAWIYLAVVSLLVCVQVNVVRVRRLYPRNLLTPFTDDVDLTDADQRAYSSYAHAQRTKGFETVQVRFEHDGQNATAKRRLRERVGRRPAAPGQRGDAPRAEPRPELPAPEQFPVEAIPEKVVEMTPETTES